MGRTTRLAIMLCGSIFGVLSCGWAGMSHEERMLREMQALEDATEKVLDESAFSSHSSEYILGCIVSAHVVVFDSDLGVYKKKMVSLEDDEIRQVINDYYAKNIFYTNLSFRKGDLIVQGQEYHFSPKGGLGVSQDNPFILKR